MAVNLMNTIKGSLLEGFFPEGWNLEAWDKCAAVTPKNFDKPKRWWHKQFQPVCCPTLGDFDTMMGHEIAMEIRNARDAKKPLILILPVGPMGMYKWAVYFLKEWGVKCGHVHGFNMDEWSDPSGNTPTPAKDRRVPERHGTGLYGPLGNLTVPARQRHFATRRTAPHVRPADRRIAQTRRASCHGLRHRPRLPYRLLGTPFRQRICLARAMESRRIPSWRRLHPLTIEQNAITSFRAAPPRPRHG